MSKKDVQYTTTEVFEEANTLFDNGKVKEAFALASTGAISYLEEVSGQKYIIMKQEKFDELISKGVIANE